MNVGKCDDEFVDLAVVLDEVNIQSGFHVTRVLPNALTSERQQVH